MADIDVVKKGSKIWLWILLILAALLVFWFVAGRGDQGRVGARTEGGQPFAAALALAVSSAPSSIRSDD